ncbi:hypothetical protein KIPB_013281, partial [Kipferlia bialata]
TVSFTTGALVTDVTSAGVTFATAATLETTVGDLTVGAGGSVAVQDLSKLEGPGGAAQSIAFPDSTTITVSGLSSVTVPAGGLQFTGEPIDINNALNVDGTFTVTDQVTIEAATSLGGDVSLDGALSFTTDAVTSGAGDSITITAGATSDVGQSGGDLVLDAGAGQTALIGGAISVGGTNASSITLGADTTFDKDVTITGDVELAGDSAITVAASAAGQNGDDLTLTAGTVSDDNRTGGSVVINAGAGSAVGGTDGSIEIGAVAASITLGDSSSAVSTGTVEVIGDTVTLGHNTASVIDASVSVSATGVNIVGDLWMAPSDSDSVGAIAPLTPSGSADGYDMVISGGAPSSVTNDAGDLVLRAGAGNTSTYDGSISLGVTATKAITVGAASVDIDMTGNLTLDSDLTFTGAKTITTETDGADLTIQAGGGATGGDLHINAASAGTSGVINIGLANTAGIVLG